MRLIAMPGARRRRMVTMKLMAPPVVEIGQEDQRQRIKVHAEPWRIFGQRVRHICKPTGVRRLPQKGAM